MGACIQSKDTANDDVIKVGMGQNVVNDTVLREAIKAATKAANTPTVL